MGKGKQTCPSFHSSIFLFVSFSSLPSCMKLFMMNVLPHLQTAFKLIQSGFCTTTPCMVIIRDLLVPNLVLSFRSSFYLTSANILTVVHFLPESLSFFDHCDFLVFLSIFLRIPVLHPSLTPSDSGNP